MKKIPFASGAIPRTKKTAKKLYKTFGYWFRNHYRLPPTDPRYLDMTPEEIEIEYWAWNYLQNGVGDEIETDGYNTDDVLAAMESDDWEDVL